MPEEEDDRSSRSVRMCYVIIVVIFLLNNDTIPLASFALPIYNFQFMIISVLVFFGNKQELLFHRRSPRPATVCDCTSSSVSSAATYLLTCYYAFCLSHRGGSFQRAR